MGINNSSKTRVEPLGKELLDKHDLVDKLISMTSENKPINFGSFNNDNVFFAGVKHEKGLQPSKTHLINIINIIEEDKMLCSSIRNKAIKNSSGKNREKREQLFSLDKKTLNEAKELINKKHHIRSWEIFEGKSYPDLFIENDQYILIIEGKRTEKAKTGKVSYLPKRSQMIRHLENALNYDKTGNKKIIAFYIIEEGCAYTNKCNSKTMKKELIEETIFINQKLKKAILDSFYGYTTWQAISKQLGISFSF